MFSVIIPTCNRPDLLTACLERLAPGQQHEMLGPQRQAAAHAVDSPLPSRPVPAEDTRAVYEVIVTDDGRKNPAADLIRTRYPWVQWIPGPAVGPAANRNNGASHANGEWLVFFDDDCLPDRRCLPAYATFLRSDPPIDVIEGCILPEGKRSRVDQEAPVNATGGYLWAANFAIRRSLFEAIRGFDVRFPFPAMEDIDLRYRLECCGGRFAFLRDAVVYHPWRKKRGRTFIRQHTSSLLYFYNKHPELKPKISVASETIRFLRTMKHDILPASLKCHGLGGGRAVFLAVYDAVVRYRMLVLP